VDQVAGDLHQQCADQFLRNGPGAGPRHGQSGRLRRQRLLPPHRADPGGSHRRRRCPGEMPRQPGRAPRPGPTPATPTPKPWRRSWQPDVDSAKRVTRSPTRSAKW
jgi:hypothetical protein